MTKNTLMQKSKVELVDLVIALKEEILKNREVLETRANEGADLDKLAFGVVLTDGKFQLAEVQFNEKSKSASVSKITDLGSERALAIFAAKRFLIEEVFEKI